MKPITEAAQERLREKLKQKKNHKRKYFNWGHPDVFSLEYSRVSSVKTQLIYFQIISMTTCHTCSNLTVN